MFSFLLIAGLGHVALANAPSDFENWIATQGGVRYPFTALVQDFNDINQRTLIARGRSLQSPDADEIEPRVVEGLFLPNGEPIFIGYAPRANQIEVLSWNSNEGLFDFLIVRDYRSDGTPSIQHAPRGLCMTCHQAGGPIFPHTPWSETLAGASTLAAIAAVGDRDYQGFDRQALESDSFIEQALDHMIRGANRKAQLARACREGCGANLACRRDLLMARLTRGPTPDVNLIARLASELTPTWPGDGFAFQSSVIPDRDPYLHPETDGTARLTQLQDKEAFIHSVTYFLQNPASLATPLEAQLRPGEWLDFEETLFPNAVQAFAQGVTLSTFAANSEPLVDPTTDRPFVGALSAADAAQIFAKEVPEYHPLTQTLGCVDVKASVLPAGTVPITLLEAWPPSADAVAQWVKNSVR